MVLSEKGMARPDKADESAKSCGRMMHLWLTCAQRGNYTGRERQR